MNQDQINITGMHGSVAAYLTQNSTVWNGVKAVSTTVAALNANNAIIASKANEQETATDGAAAQKNQLKHDLRKRFWRLPTSFLRWRPGTMMSLLARRWS